MNFDEERKQIARAAEIHKKAEKSIRAKLEPIWDDVDALCAAHTDCPECRAKDFVTDQLRRLWGDI